MVFDLVWNDKNFNIKLKKKKKSNGDKVKNIK